MALGPVFQSSVVFINIFQGDPDTAHKPFGNRREMGMVGMHVLLGSNRKIQALEREGLFSINSRENV